MPWITLNIIVFYYEFCINQHAFLEMKWMFRCALNCLIAVHWKTFLTKGEKNGFFYVIDCFPLSFKQAERTVSYSIVISLKSISIIRKKVK